ncbi:hypothetical protein [Streptomyces sp. V1I6]|jgi:hypothetical protein|uniref:hypothetical protein n=1 Tax=Streptomyces sp. V1I6 TaxID=3042273 RepID=UPI002784ABD0|nr:hypothetical protein [Streptomyces sp. V1I6]MDQ0844687.1 hypothetical protein [Streptomyces sp. V1I6]
MSIYRGTRMEIRLKVVDADLAAEHARSLHHWLRGQDGDRWETALEYGTDTVAVLLLDEGAAARLAWSVVEWRGRRTGTPVVVAESAGGPPVPRELVRILAEESPPHGGGAVTVLEPDDRVPGAVHHARPPERDLDFGGPPGPVLDPDDDWDRD